MTDATMGIGKVIDTGLKAAGAAAKAGELKAVEAAPKLVLKVAEKPTFVPADPGQLEALRRAKLAALRPPVDVALSGAYAEAARAMMNTQSPSEVMVLFQDLSRSLGHDSGDAQLMTLQRVAMRRQDALYKARGW